MPTTFTKWSYFYKYNSIAFVILPGLAGGLALELDVFNEQTWYRLNRPHEDLRWRIILEGMLTFADHYPGKLVTETMLIQGVNANETQLRHVAAFIGCLSPAVAYLSIPTRPPAHSWVCAPDEKSIHQAYQIFNTRITKVELLIGDEGDAFAFTGNVENDLMSITAVHPMHEDAVAGLLGKAGVEWDVIQKMIDDGKLIELHYQGKNFWFIRLKRTWIHVERRFSV